MPTKNRNNKILLKLMTALLLLFPAMVCANPSPAPPKGVIVWFYGFGFWASLIFAFWYIWGVMEYVFFRRLRHLYFILGLLIPFLVSLKNMVFGDVFSMVFGYYLFFYIAYLIIAPGKLKRRSGVWELARNLIAFVILIIAAKIYRIHNPIIFNDSTLGSRIFYACIGLYSLLLLYMGLVYTEGAEFWEKLNDNRRLRFLSASFVFLILGGTLISTGFALPLSRPFLVNKLRMDVMERGVEAYFADHRSFPDWIVGMKHSANGFMDYDSYISEKLEKIPTFENPDGRGFASLTTPVAYIPHYYGDRFGDSGETFGYYSVNHETDPEKSGWIMWSVGPNFKYELNIDIVKELYDPGIPQPSPELLRYLYDPTNGQNSSGDIFRVKI